MIKNQKGMTLLELMMTVSISTIITYSVFASMRVTQDSFESGNVRMTIQASAREGMYRMIQEIRDSSPSRIAITGTGGTTITFNIPNSTTPVTAGYAINWGDQIRYALSGTQVIRTNLTTNQTSVMANNVTALTFTGNTASAPTVVTAAISVQKTMTNGRTVPASPLQMTGQAKIRNP